jgi:hypothetical protein
VKACCHDKSLGVVPKQFHEIIFARISCIFCLLKKLITKIRVSIEVNHRFNFRIEFGLSFDIVA